MGPRLSCQHLQRECAAHLRSGRLASLIFENDRSSSPALPLESICLAPRDRSSRHSFPTSLASPFEEATAAHCMIFFKGSRRLSWHRLIELLYVGWGGVLFTVTNQRQRGEAQKGQIP